MPNRREAAGTTFRYALRSFQDQTVELRANARAGEDGQTFGDQPEWRAGWGSSFAGAGGQGRRHALPGSASGETDVARGVECPAAADQGEGNAVELLKLTAVDATSPVPATLPWDEDALRCKDRPTGERLMEGTVFFDDGVTLSNQWQGELSSEDATLIPNDAQHLELARDEQNRKFADRHHSRFESSRPDRSAPASTQRTRHGA